ncbi:hypothetical protein FACS189459_3600 [Bacilli bacterium]|nr:hypothetical protein FACS189459_3600 [Bacilli bacterium]
MRTLTGDEEITRDIPNTSTEAKSYLNESGIINIGAEVKEGDILVGKITPKGQVDYTAEEKLLHAIFGDKANNYRDSSLKVPHGGDGIVFKILRNSLSSQGKTKIQLEDDVIETITIYVAQKRKVQIGDKLAGRHGNKGVISIVVPQEDMPYMEDGTPIDILLNPQGVPSRMNIGQVYETHIGLAMREIAKQKLFKAILEKEDISVLTQAFGIIEPKAKILFKVVSDYFKEHDITTYAQAIDKIKMIDYKIIMNKAGVEIEDIGYKMSTPAFSGATYADVVDAMEEANLEPNKTLGKFTLTDGRTGEKFEEDIAVGVMYIMKLNHMVDDKLHARSIGPYSKITQQPLGGKRQKGGRKFGEMEV